MQPRDFRNSSRDPGANFDNASFLIPVMYAEKSKQDIFPPNQSEPILMEVTDHQIKLVPIMLGSVISITPMTAEQLKNPHNHPEAKGVLTTDKYVFSIPIDPVEFMQKVADGTATVNKNPAYIKLEDLIMSVASNGKVPLPVPQEAGPRDPRRSLGGFKPEGLNQ